MRAPHRITNPRRSHAGYGSASLILGALELTTKQRITNPRATSRYRGQKMKEPLRNLYRNKPRTKDERTFEKPLQKQDQNQDRKRQFKTETSSQQQDIKPKARHPAKDCPAQEETARPSRLLSSITFHFLSPIPFYHLSPAIIATNSIDHSYHRSPSIIDDLLSLITSYHRSPPITDPFL
jgi:hypothetical protein